MVVENGVIKFFHRNTSHCFNFPKFLISVEMVVEYGVINFFNQNNSHNFNVPKFLIALRWS